MKSKQKSNMHTCCRLSSNLHSSTSLHFVTSDSDPAAAASFLTRKRRPGVSGREAINCSSRGRSFCRINVVSGATGLLQLNDIKVFRQLSDANVSSGQSKAYSSVSTQLPSLPHPEIKSSGENFDCAVAKFQQH